MEFLGHDGKTNRIESVAVAPVESDQMVVSRFQAQGPIFVHVVTASKCLRVDAVPRRESHERELPIIVVVSDSESDASDLVVVRHLITVVEVPVPND